MNEGYLLFLLKGYGIPEIISFGHKGKYNVMIEELLSKSIQELFELNDNEMPLKDVCMIAIQLLERIEYIHSKFIIHRNINPTNFVIGEKNNFLIYVIDFVMAKKYRSSRTGKHLKFNLNQKIFGNVSFISVNSMRGMEQSRRDDLESLGYMLIYLLKGYLPWKEFENKNDKIQKIFQLKRKISLSRLCRYLPEEIKKYIEYCKILSFEQEPNYEYLKGLFKQILIKIQKINDNIFFWNKNKKIDNKNIKININKRRESPSMGLYRKIHSSFNKNNINNFFDENISDRINNTKKKHYSKTELMVKVLNNSQRGKDKYDSLNRNNNKLSSTGLIDNNYIYKKKNNINSYINNSIRNNKTTFNSNDEKIKDENKIIYINCFKSSELSNLEEKSDKIKNLKQNIGKSVKSEINDKFLHNLNIIEHKNTLPIEKYKRKTFNEEKSKSLSNYILYNKGSLRNIERKGKSKINYNNQNYIDNINIIGYLNTDNKITINNSNNYLNKNKNKNFISKIIIKKIREKNINPKNNRPQYCPTEYNENKITYHSIFHRKIKTNFNLIDNLPIKEDRTEIKNNKNINLPNNQIQKKKSTNMIKKENNKPNNDLKKNYINSNINKNELDFILQIEPNIWEQYSKYKTRKQEYKNISNNKVIK